VCLCVCVFFYLCLCVLLSAYLFVCVCVCLVVRGSEDWLHLCNIDTSRSHDICVFTILFQIQHVVEQSAVNLHLHTESGISSALQLNDALETSRELLKSIQKLVAPQGGQEGDEARPLSQAQLLELFVNLFGQLQRGKLLSSAIGDDSRGSSFEDLLSAGLEGDGTRNGQGQGAAVTRLDSDTSSVEGGSVRVMTDAVQAGCGSPERVGDRERIVRAAMAESPLMDIGDPTTYDHSADLFSAPMMSAPQSLGLGSEGVMGGSDSRSGSSKNGGGQSMKGGGRGGHGSDNSGEGADATAVQVAHRPNQARNRLMEAFHKLKQVGQCRE